MGGGSTSLPYLRFAAISLLIVSMVWAAAVIVGVRLVGVGQQQSAADHLDRAVGAPIGNLLASQGGGDTLTNGTASSVDALVDVLLEGSLAGVRIYNESGDAVYTGGAPPADVGQRGANRLPLRAETPAGEAVFVTYAARNGFVIEMSEDLAPLDRAIASARWEMAFAVSAFGVTVWVLSIGAFWFGIRRFSVKHGELAYLYDTGQQLRESLDLHDVLARVASDATTLARGNFGTLALIDATSGDLLLKTTYNHGTGTVALHQRPLDEWYVRRCVATNTTVVSSQGADRYRQYFTNGEEISRDGSLLCVPMSVHAKVIGAITVVRSAGREAGFATSEIRLVEELASQAVTAVEQAQLFAKVRADATALEQGYDTTLKALMAALDAKDDATEGHCERVAKLTVQLAKAMNVAPSLLVHIERGALLHDVGKIGVPDAILKKPKKLNDGEWEAMRKHPLLAGLMVSKIGFLEPALPILLYHHERYDGTGYPFGLKGENIPVEARIFSIIDAYDAMTSDRPYRAAMSHQDAMDEVHRNSGLQFDPEVVDAFSRLLLERPELRQVSGYRMIESHDHDDDPNLRPSETAA
jgi:HD-GYP domain-containing protein (c-di-GMP phosphodiesterase class II)